MINLNEYCNVQSVDGSKIIHVTKTYMDKIDAKLRAADELCRVVKKVAVASAATLDKAIAEFEGDR